MTPSPRLLNVIDIEATCWAGDPPPGEVSEIIEVGLCVIDLDAGERVAQRQILVHPSRSSVSPFCTELTGHTAEGLADGLSFIEACDTLRAEFRSASLPWASWGDYDRKQFQAQCAAAGTRYPFGSRHVNAKAVFTEAHKLRKRPGMAQALELACLPLEGRHHRGVDDAWNIAALILGLVKAGTWPTAE